MKNQMEPVILNFNNNKIKQVDDTKMLGLIIDSRLSWEPHLVSLRSKLCSAVYALRKVAVTLDLISLKMIYYGYIHSLLSYGIVFWGSSSELQEIFKIQKWSIRIIKKISNRTSCRPFFKELSILPLPSLYIFELLTFVKGNEPVFVRNSDFHNYNTRHKESFSVEKHCSALYERGPRNAGITLYNKLPKEITRLFSVFTC